MSWCKQFIYLISLSILTFVISGCGGSGNSTNNVMQPQAKANIPTEKPNEGAGWEWVLPQPTGNHLTSVSFANEMSGVSIGSHGTILSTSDGGKTWTSIKSGTIQTLNDVQFVDGLVGYAVGYLGTVIKTVDGGKSWTRIPIGTQAPLMAVQFLDANIGYVVSNQGFIAKTSDGAKTGLHFLQMCLLI